MKKLPIGIQTFSEIITEGYVYVDKTEIAYNLIDRGKYYFLSRPRRFGKSLFLDTLKDIFEGKKELFKGLYIYDKWDWEVKYPVLRVSLGSGVHQSVQDLSENLLWILKKTERDLGVNCNKNLKPKQCFEHLLISAYEKYNQKVVVLIDEYDKPILDNITDEVTPVSTGINKEVAREMRDAMKDFYGVIKDNDAYIQFVFITGVSKFSKMNLFSGLNNLEDITLHPDYGNICGYTHNDLLTVFEEHLRGVDMQLVKQWYNGYNYFGDKVYNPFDILLFISNKFKFSNYWWETGNPSFLIDMLKTRNYYIPELENFVASKEILNTFDIDNIELVALLWQTGYLTITEETSTPFGIKYRLNTPNREIQTSLNSLFINYLTKQVTEKLKFQEKLYGMLDKPDLDGFKDALFSLFASIPYSNFTNSKLPEYEGYYASVVYAYLASIGLDIIPEDITNLGRMDLSAKLEGKVFIFEFKLSEKATGNALKQIKERRYWEKFQDAENIYLVGIEFSREDRNVIGYEWEKI